MKKVIDKSDSRGHSLYDWLDSHHTFSFDEYYNPRRMNFGALRVLNDDRVAPGKGFGTHPHKNMEIISIPLKGKLKHGDSHQNSRVITPGDIQTMSAGTGIYHSEMNGSDTEAVEFLQIWVMPEKLTQNQLLESILFGFFLSNNFFTNFNNSLVGGNFDCPYTICKLPDVS